MVKPVAGDPVTDEAAVSETRPWWRDASRSWIELAALSGFAIAQPLLDVYGRAPEAFIFRDAEPGDIVAFGLAVVLVPPTVLWAVEQAVRLASARIARFVHVAFVAVLIAAFASQALKDVGLDPGPLVAAGAVVAGGLAAFAYLRLAVVRQWLAFCAFAPVLFLALFLGASPAADLLSGQDVAAAEVDPVETPHPIVYIVWDEWPLMSILDEDGEIDADLYPNLAALAADGAFYRNATTTATATPYAIPSLVTGRYPPDETTSPLANEYPESLFTLLANEYDLEVQESVTRLCPPNLCGGELVDHPDAPTSDAASGESDAPTEDAGSALGTLLTEARGVYRTMASPFDEGVITSFDEAASMVAGASAADEGPPEADVDAAVDEARRYGEQGTGAEDPNPTFGLGSLGDLNASIEAGEGPTLHFTHLQVPHAPYRYLPTEQAYEVPQDLLRVEMDVHTVGSQPDEQTAVDLDHQRLLLQVGYVDALVGQVVERLRETGLYDDSIIVLTSDHGSGFVPGETIRALGNTEPLDESVYGDILYVPLIVKGPGMTPGTVDDRNAMSIDIVPTLADMIGVELPWPVDGRSLLAEPRDSAQKQFHLVTMQSANGHLTNPIGPAVLFDGSVFQRAALDHHVGTLLRGDNPEYAFYDIDDAGEIIGLETGELTADDGGPTGWSATVEALDHFDDVDLAAPLPLHVRGSLRGDLSDGPVTVAISLNGRIAGVTSTYLFDGDPHHFELILEPSAVRAGANTVELLAVEGDEGARELGAIELE